MRPHTIRSWKYPITYEIAPDVDVDLLGLALAAVVNRHEPLRLRLIADRSAPGQRIAPPVDTFPIAQLDDGPSTLADFFAESFDLAADGPLRAALVRRPGGRSRLLLAVHHLAWDGMSSAPFTHDLWAAYRNLRACGESRLPVPQISYSDHVLAQRAAGPRLTPTQAAYWEEVFAGWRLPDFEPPPSASPVEWSRRITGSVPDPAIAGRVRMLARAVRVTPPVVWLASALVALWGTDQSGRGSHVSVYWVHHGRDRAELRDLVGFFNRSVPLRLAMDPGERFDRFCARVLGQVQAAVRESRAPWSIQRLAAHLSGPKAPGQRRERMSRITVNIQLDDSAEGTGPAGDLAAFVSYDPPSEQAWTPRLGQLWLQLTLGPAPTSFAEYDQRYFPDSTVGACLNGMPAIVAAVLDGGAGRSVSELAGCVPEPVDSGAGALGVPLPAPPSAYATPNGSAV
ncbi:condensation domain-containing protein [Rugosimonospora africana]|uniref:condensation domain-containing protein n=1 Tax=Rugosimonospora africana TaxID=556532 RepID=UPI0019448843|nr:condensation domain-containing protein [Rugosimonospora africana]